MTKQYPLMDHHNDELHAASERPLQEIELTKDDLAIDDVNISAETLHAQAEIARQVGNVQLAANLSRAAELVAVPNDELLKIYDLLRPERATYEQLTRLAERLDVVYKAPLNATLVREAAAAYRERGLLKRVSKDE